MIRSASPAIRNQIALPFASCALFAVFAFSPARTTAQLPTRLETKHASQPVRRIVVSIPDHKLALLENGRIVKVYDVAVGAPVSPSPTGQYQIAQRLENPTYYTPGVVIGPGKGNPLGPRWIGLDLKGFGIHGTNHPDSIGKNASHGCIRLRNRDIEDLFARVKVGDHVSLVAERTEEVARLFGTAPNPAHAPEALLAQNEQAASQESEPRGER